MRTKFMEMHGGFTLVNGSKLVWLDRKDGWSRAQVEKVVDIVEQAENCFNQSYDQEMQEMEHLIDNLKEDILYLKENILYLKDNTR